MLHPQVVRNSKWNPFLAMEAKRNSFKMIADAHYPVKKKWQEKFAEWELKYNSNEIRKKNITICIGCLNQVFHNYLLLTNQTAESVNHHDVTNSWCRTICRLHLVVAICCTIPVEIGSTPQLIRNEQIHTLNMLLLVVMNCSNHSVCLSW